MSWMEAAVCAQADPDAWFPEPGASNVEAKRICAECPVRTACLEYALTNGLDFGVYGGLSARERLALGVPRPKRERPINHGTEGGYKTHRKRGQAPCDDCRTAQGEAKKRREALRAS